MYMLLEKYQTNCKRFNQIMNLDVKVFEKRLQEGELTIENLINIDGMVSRTIISDARVRNNPCFNNGLRTIILSEPNMSLMQAKVFTLGMIFNDDQYFQDINIAIKDNKELLAFTFNTTVNNVECKLILDAYKTKLMERGTSYTRK